MAPRSGDDGGPGETADILGDILGGDQDVHDSFDLGVELEPEQHDEVQDFLSNAPAITATAVKRHNC